MLSKAWLKLCSNNNDNKKSFSDSLMSCWLLMSAQVFVHADAQQRPLFWPYTGMSGTQRLSWVLTS